MPDTATLTIKLDDETARRLQQLAAEGGETAEALAAEAVGDMVAMAFDDGLVPPHMRRSVEEDEAIIRETMARIEDGTAEFISHEDAMKRFRATARGEPR
jgi:predicted transcriptional regulator